MKKFLLLLALVMVSSVAVHSQEESSVVVVLKNGTTITGKVKQFDPATKIVVNVGGFDTTINMSDVSSVTNAGAKTSAKNSANVAEGITPTTNLPEDTIINICGVDVKFILMKGGKFKYGFDGRGSLSMDSEPVHDVVLSPYYVSEELVSRDLYKAVMKKDFPADFMIKYADKKITDTSLNKCAFFMSEDLAKFKSVPSLEEFIKTLQAIHGEKIDIPTEVQWFYCESRKSRETTRQKTPTLLYCQFALNVSMSDEHDPVGQFVVVKGATKHNDDDEFETYRLYDRAQTKMTNIERYTAKTYNIYKYKRMKSLYSTFPWCCSYASTIFCASISASATLSLPVNAVKPE